MDATNKALGQRIRTLRTVQELSQDTLAEKAGLSVKHLGKIERGTVNASIHCLTSIATALGLPVRDVLETEHVRTREELSSEVIRLVPALSDKDLQIVYRMMKMLTTG